MSFIRNDGGRAEAGYKGKAGDCVTRSIAIASGRPYAEVYAALSKGTKTQRRTTRSGPYSSARDGVHTTRKWFKDYMVTLGFRWVPTMQIGSGCTVHLTADELPSGRLVVAVSKHYTAMIDGIIHDTHDPRRPMVETTPSNQTPRHIETRAVYGYWKLEG